MNARTRFLALPLLTAGILGGALGLAGTAAAQTTTAHHTGHVATTPRDARSHMPTHFRVFGERLGTTATAQHSTAHTPQAQTYRHRHHRHYYRAW